MPSSKYWRARLEGAPPQSGLVPDHPRREGGAHDWRAEPVPLAPGTPERIARLAARASVDAPTVALAALAAVLGRHTGQDDLVVGFRDGDGRWCPVRSRRRARTTFAEMVREVATEVAAARAHPLSAAELLELAGGRTAAVPAPFRVGCILPGGARRELEALARSAGWPLDLLLAGNLGAGDPALSPSATLELVHDPALVPRETIAGFAHRFARALDALLDAPERPVAALDFTPAAELERLRDWNRTAVAFSADRCLHQLIEAQACRQPDAAAVIGARETLSYAELDARSNRLAHHLRGLGVERNQPVAVALARSPELAIALVGIAKAGGAYVPLDPSYPRERLRYMQSSVNASVLVTVEKLAGELSLDAGDTVLLDAGRGAIEAQPAASPPPAADATSLAYVIFTSGSTGSPKPIALDHRGRVNNFEDFNRRFAVGPGDRLLGVSSTSFDMTAYDVFGTLAAGATLVLPEEDDRDPALWTRLVRRHGITIWHSVPALLVLLVEHAERRRDGALGSVRLALLGGDWIPLTLPDRLRALAPRARFVSMGGATECSMDSTLYEVARVDPSWRSIPYGRPMANQTAYLLDDDGHLVPPGTTGELYLGGIGVAWGYLGRPELTAERFVPHPYPSYPGERLYRTGDLARLDAGGELELLGRADQQVKIRGNRVELGEIVAALREHPAVREAVVTARGPRDGDRSLAAYVVLEPSSGLAAATRSEQVDEWRRVYDQTYGAKAAAPADPTFDTAGWSSSYTGLPIPDDEMREWVDTTVARILARGPRRVLEIGCGTGLLLFRIAPHCERYCGLDFSAAALEQVRAALAGRGLSGVELVRGSADDLSAFAPRSFDAVLLNSITQLFPDLDYLVAVVSAAIERVSAGGFVFVGDNRSLPHLPLHHASLQLAQAPPHTTLPELRERIRRSMEREEQLAIDPALFTVLAAAEPRVGAVAVEVKRGRCVNELTKFRYDVFLEIEPALAASTEPPTPAAETAVTLAWRDGETTLRDVAMALAAARGKWVQVEGIPNARLAPEVTIAQLLDEPASAEGAAAEDVRGLRRRVAGAASGGADPEEIYALAQEQERAVTVAWAASRDPGRVDALFRPGAVLALPRTAPSPPEPRPQTEWARYANRPLAARLAARLESELRAHLESRLAPYMVPSAFVVLDALPLTPNGKVDREALPDPGRAWRPELATPFVPPADALEEVVAAIWQDVLGYRVGARDAFMELGGHSLLAAQIEARVHELFGLDLPLRHFLGGACVADQALWIRRAGAAANVDADQIASTILRLDEVTDAELESALGGAGAPG
ncbi:MAG TPA: amino acid adenylation domain-containing protein [Thermoanaerobaculia bacterium]|nr:amino acid adenylation domain-containing protein [Thermoanaerobaculia bacterium]